MKRLEQMLGMMADEDQVISQARLKLKIAEVGSSSVPACARSDLGTLHREGLELLMEIDTEDINVSFPYFYEDSESTREKSKIRNREIP